ncbi:hypothetical protein BV511_14830 [Methylorubrum extorquens]|uniref:Uncharacterized protein n=1 Tax=Methylorubrum extorquens (strain ATCC 14718 / DSM 1338 / JCM 2805 / NCIMB 9133 / AM1) TaxID=272630 RepID=C5B4D4_METEA|nr:Hypothetical protein MexAM1_META2p0465 [Methylorubrum extorquens AM1]APX85872.1 hypothetical protein BV511_14830 [Methylorubrum extorquens]ARO57632.1 hypothetical protein B2G69_25660 [Methylorubrum zatmanii]
MADQRKDEAGDKGRAYPLHKNRNPERASRVPLSVQLIPGMRRHHNGPEIVARKHHYGATAAQHFAKPGI